ncbi:MAG: alpha/beta hydrolase [Myxococcales bacterium]|nr:alpha/beta hydrolase [Myxococcales bacterium]
MKRWQQFDDETREYHYNPQKSVEDFSRFQTHRSAISQVCRSVMKSHLDVAYGEGELHRLDIYPAGPGSPVHVFFHGGYWRTQDKQNFAFLARDLVQKGVTLVVANYDLCPAATLDEVTGSALNAIAFCHASIAEYGGDPNAISVSGNSAGAHLCSMALATDWSARGLPADLIKGAVLISGIFDPEPARHISVDAELKLDDGLIARNDTQALKPHFDCPVHIFAGGREPWGWVELSFDYYRHLREHGHDPALRQEPRLGGVPAEVVDLGVDHGPRGVPSRACALHVAQALEGARQHDARRGGTLHRYLRVQTGDGRLRCHERVLGGSPRRTQPCQQGEGFHLEANEVVCQAEHPRLLGRLFSACWKSVWVGRPCTDQRAGRQEPLAGGQVGTVSGDVDTQLVEDHRGSLDLASLEVELDHGALRFLPRGRGLGRDHRAQYVVRVCEELRGPFGLPERVVVEREQGQLAT